MYHARDTLGRAASAFDFVRCIPIVWPSRVLTAPKLAPVVTATADAAFVFLVNSAVLVYGFQHTNPKYHMPRWWRCHCSSALQLLSVLVLELAQMTREHKDHQLPAAAVSVLQPRETMLWDTAVLLLNVHGAQLARSLLSSKALAAGAARPAAAALATAQHEPVKHPADNMLAHNGSSSSDSSSSMASAHSPVSSVQLQSEGWLQCYADILRAGSETAQLGYQHAQQWLCEYEQHWQELQMPPELQQALTQGCEVDGGNAVTAADISLGQGLSANGNTSHCSSSSSTQSIRMRNGSSSNGGSSTTQFQQVRDCLLLVQGAAMVIRYITANGSVQLPAKGALHDVGRISSTGKAVSQSLSLLLLRTAAAAVCLSPVQALPTVTSCLDALSELNAKLGPYSEGPSTAKGSSNGPHDGSSSSTTSKGAVSSKGKTAAQQHKQLSTATQTSAKGCGTLDLQQQQQQQLGGLIQVLQLMLGLGQHRMQIHRLQPPAELEQQQQQKNQKAQGQLQRQEQKQSPEMTCLMTIFYAIRACLEKLPCLLGLQLQQLTNSYSTS